MTEPKPDTLREEIEKERQAAIVVAKAVCNINGRVSQARLDEIVPAINRIVSVAHRIVMRERERWGHVKNCACCNSPKHHGHLPKDPRCADRQQPQQTEPES